MGRHINTHHPARWATTGLIITTLALTACGGSDDDASASLGGNEAAAATVAPSGVGDDMIATEESAQADEPSPPGTGDGGAGIDFGDLGRDVITEMHVLMKSDDIARSVAAITSDAAALGGGVASSDVNYGTDDDATPSGHAVLVVRVPPGNVLRLLDRLDTTGSVVSLNQSAQDVTEQLVDLDIRIANARESVANVREFMDQTTDLSQLVTLESELTRRQTELEQLEAQQHNLGDRVELATVTVEIAPTTPPAPPPSAPEPDEGLADGLRSGWNAFVSTVFAVTYVLAVMAPFLVVGLVVIGIAWALHRRRRPITVTPVRPADPVISEQQDRGPATPVG
jgi:hypothetical protein